MTSSFNSKDKKMNLSDKEGMFTDKPLPGYYPPNYILLGQKKENSNCFFPLRKGHRIETRTKLLYTPLLFNLLSLTIVSASINSFPCQSDTIWKRPTLGLPRMPI